MTNVALPLRVRIPAYVTSAVTALAGTPTVTYLAAEHIIDTPTTVWLGVLIAGIHIGADALALSHLTLPSDGDAERATKLADLAAATADLRAEVSRSAVAASKAVDKAVTKAASKPAAKNKA